MRANVLNDSALVKRAGQFAWLSIDSDKPANAAFTSKFPAEGVPVFLVIDPAGEKVALSWYGSVTATQIGGLMDDGLRVIAGGGSGPDALLARADAANARKDFAAAAEAYDNALKLADQKWPRRPRVIESLVMAYYFARNPEACVETALREAPGMARDRSFVNVVYFALDSAKPGTPQSHDAEKLAEVGVKIPGVLTDDTSQLYMTLADKYRAEKDEPATARTLNAWVEYLHGQLAAARGPEARMALDLQLVSAANRLGKPEIAVSELERVERELPRDYNPPRLLTGLLSRMGRLDDAYAACTRALDRAYGVPMVRLYPHCGGVL
jgi:tetratricopeptide (TPR) repeat protein